MQSIKQGFVYRKRDNTIKLLDKRYYVLVYEIPYQGEMYSHNNYRCLGTNDLALGFGHNFYINKSQFHREYEIDTASTLEYKLFLKRANTPKNKYKQGSSDESKKSQ